MAEYQATQQMAGRFKPHVWGQDPGSMGDIANSRGKDALNKAHLATIAQQMQHNEVEHRQRVVHQDELHQLELERQGLELKHARGTLDSGIDAVNAENQARTATANVTTTVAQGTEDLELQARQAHLEAQIAGHHRDIAKAHREAMVAQLNDEADEPPVGHHPGTPLPDPNASHSVPKPAWEAPTLTHHQATYVYRGETGVPVGPGHDEAVRQGKWHRCGKCGYAVAKTHNAKNCDLS